MLEIEPLRIHLPRAVMLEVKAHLAVTVGFLDGS